MYETTHMEETRGRGAVSRPIARVATIPVLALGLASSLFLGISFVLCVGSYLMFPSLPVAHGLLSLVLPGFVLLTWRSFLLGLIESLGWGWYVSLVFGPLYNYFVSRFAHARA
jgi:hypothetical protein